MAMTHQAPIGVHLKGGVELLAEIRALVGRANLTFCNVHGFGELESVELKGSQNSESVILEGPFALLSLHGRVRQVNNVCIDEYTCSLSRQTDNGIQLIGGRLSSAIVESVELTLTQLTLLESEASSAKGSGAGRTTASTHQPSPTQVEPTAVHAPPEADNVWTSPTETDASTQQKWAQAIAESRRIEREAPPLDDEPEDRPDHGDIVNHRQFGRCTVTRIDDEHVTLRKPNGRQVQLGLHILKFSLKDEEGKRMVFDVEVRPRR